AALAGHRLHLATSPLSRRAAYLWVKVSAGAWERERHRAGASARLLAEQGQAECAVELYALVSRYPYVADSRFYHDMVGQRIATAAATLLPQVREAAEARGRARDLWATARELLAELEAAQLVAEWLRRAQADMAVTALADDERIPPEVVAFHAQQAVEKVLKAMLVR
ncbi:MAG: HEPN domain-containing protein, partial [Anaerolineae bacterium]|nr:HEPN domain-containing protein [Anaerolineae bacterium]